MGSISDKTARGDRDRIALSTWCGSAAGCNGDPSVSSWVRALVGSARSSHQSYDRGPPQPQARQRRSWQGLRGAYGLERTRPHPAVRRRSAPHRLRPDGRGRGSSRRLHPTVRRGVESRPPVRSPSAARRRKWRPPPRGEAVPAGVERPRCAASWYHSLAGGRASGPAATDRQDLAAVEEPGSRPLGLMRGRRHRRKRHEGPTHGQHEKTFGTGCQSVFSAIQWCTNRK
jgi:hypothetical protein